MTSTSGPDGKDRTYIFVITADIVTFNYVLDDRMETAKEIPFQEVTTFHGHICPGQS